MSRQSISIGRVLGIPVGVDYSWFLIFALVTWSLATGYFPGEYKHWPGAVYWLVGGLTAVLFFGSVFLHELAHSFVAQRFKVPVRRITLYIFGGVSEMEVEPPSAWSELGITISGPLMNLLLAGLFALLALVFSALAPLQALVKYLAYMNLILGLFNLIPGYPLDGGGVLMSIIWGITHRRNWGVVAAASSGSFFAYLLILLGVLQVVGGSLLNGLWTAFIGWFLLNASGGAMRQERLKELLAGQTVGQAMSNNYTIIYPDTTLQCLLDEHILGGSRRCFIVTQGNQVVGMLTLRELRNTPRGEWAGKTVEEVMVPIERLITVQPATELSQAMQEMDRDGFNQLPVIADGQIRGVLTREDIISFLRRLQTGGARSAPQP